MQTSRVKNGDKSVLPRTVGRNYARLLLMGFFAGVIATRQFIAVNNQSPSHHDSADPSFDPPSQVAARASERLTSSIETSRDAVAATATKYLLEKSRMDAVAKKLRVSTTSSAVTTNATTSDRKDVRSTNETSQERMKTLPLIASVTTGNTTTTASEIRNSATPDRKGFGSMNEERQEKAVVKNLPPLIVSIATANASEIRDFERQKGVVIATKIHGPPHVAQLKQSLCLLNSAYNNRLHYDHVIFTTLPLSEDDVFHLQEIVHPAYLSVKTDKLTLSDHINAMTPAQKTVLYERCNKTQDEQLYWGSRCSEKGGGSPMPLAYSWQSEFRSKHIWRHKALKKYKYMMWYDSDAMASRVWHQDPVSLMVRNDLAILFANFPKGSTSGSDLRERIVEAYNGTLCELNLREGRLFAKGGKCMNPRVPQIHGFFHVTNLDFYRTPENLRWADIMIGDTKFSRRWDDQLAVTVPAAMRAPERSWEMEANGIKLDVWHNQFLDGKYRWRGGGYQGWWKNASAESFPEAIDTCQSLITNGG
jgi:hypothetical protein